MSLHFKKLFRRNKDFKGWNDYFNRHPFMTIFYSFLSFGFGAIILITFPHILLYIVSGMSFIPFEIPLSFRLIDKELIQNSGYLISSITADVHILNPEKGISILAFLIIVLTELSMIYFLYQFRRIIFSVIDDKPFIKDNVSRLRSIGLLLLISPGIVNCLLYSLSISLATENILEGLKIIEAPLKLNFGDPLFIFGGFILILTEVFRSGINLREEQDLTV